MLRRLLSALLLLAAAPFAASSTGALAAGPDDNVEWFGASHIDWQDRRPLCPVAGEAFAVRFQVYRGDITAARVNVTALGASGWVDAARVDARGPYDIWQAGIPATADDTLSYWIELTDGADTDYLGPGGMSDASPAAGWLLDFVLHSHAPVGATPTSGGGAVFKVWAPTRTTANVAGSFNNWSSTADPMAKVGEYWVARMPSGVPDRAQYKYVFNGSHWNTDPRARGLNPVNQYNAFIENPFRYAWRTSDFIPPTADELIVYQLHVGTFAGRNDPVPGAAFPARYGDVAQRVGHLAELGVNAVMLNPVNEFPGDESAGYNPISMWAPEWKYGTPDGFKTLVDSLHSRGIAVILDVVWNHFSSTDNFLWNYDGSQQWFDTPAIETPWGSQADFDKAAVRDYFAHSAHHWLEEYRLDGFRFDATDFMNIGAQAAAGWGLMQRFNDEFDGRWAGKFAVAEQLPNDAWVTKPTSAGGAGFDAQYQDPFTDNLRQEVLDAAFGDPEMWKIRNIVLGSGPDISGQKAFNYFELHDEAWPSSGGQRFVKNIDPTAPHDDLWARGRVKLAQGLVMFSPGIPALLMGSEWLEDTDFGTGSGNRIDWSKKTTYADHFAYFREIVRLRRLLPAFRAGAPVHVFHLNEAGNVIAFRRWDDQGRPFVVVANFSNNDYADYRIGVPLSGGWRELVNSQSAAYGGSGIDNAGGLAGTDVPYDGFNQSVTLQLGRMAFAVLGAESVLDAGASDTPPAAGLRLTRVAPLPVRGAATVEFVLPEAGDARLELFDLGGRRVATLAEGPFRAGVHRVRWDGRSEAGTLPAGLYFVRLLSGGQARSQAVPVLR